MNRLYVSLIAAVCSPVFGIAQDDGGKNGLRTIKPENRIVIDSVLSGPTHKRTNDQVFDTYPMPNLYRRDYAVAMPNAYHGDNCVPMPNVYQEKPSRFIVKTDSAGSSVPDSALMGELDKLKDTLLKKQQQEQRLKADRP
ncbi:hypothetical protein [Parapedobacter pyrenivorans]|uniref:hypothetical protein n=1 Tax=Parapedobacter pyrenivorans TaxID=1305674 RepID=UPI00333F8097